MDPNTNSYSLYKISYQSTTLTSQLKWRSQRSSIPLYIVPTIGCRSRLDQRRNGVGKSDVGCLIAKWPTRVNQRITHQMISFHRNIGRPADRYAKYSCDSSIGPFGTHFDVSTSHWSFGKFATLWIISTFIFSIRSLQLRILCCCNACSTRCFILCIVHSQLSVSYRTHPTIFRIIFLCTISIFCIALAWTGNVDNPNSNVGDTTASNNFSRSLIEIFYS